MKNRLITTVFICFLACICACNIMSPEVKVIESERRPAASKPELTVSSLIDGSYLSEYDDYFKDSFANRDDWRGLKAWISFHMLGKQENNGVWTDGDYIMKTDVSYDEKSVRKFVSYINGFKEKVSDDCSVYVSVIPDRSFYSSEKDMPVSDDDRLYEALEDIVFEVIDLRDVLELSDYYMTDIHWKQECLEDVVKRLGEHMDLVTDTAYEKHSAGEFYGSLYGQYALPHQADELVYLSNEMIENCIVTDMEDSTVTDVYPASAFESMDLYDIFLGGASPWIEIENPQAETDRNLILFRDSFGSSLAPLLIASYAKITLVDTRYISSQMYDELLSYENSDVLFLYSYAVVNQSGILK